VVQVDSRAFDKSKNIEDRIAKELAKRKERAEAMNHHHRAKKLKMRAAEASEDVSGFTPSMTSNTDLLSST
jgi:hypothetical protein